MPVLDDAKHEKFARGLAEGKSKQRAAIAAGYSAAHARNQGYRLAKRDDIRRRLDEIQSKVTETVVQSIAKVETRSISERLSRVDSLQERWEKLNQIAKERSEEKGMDKVPGGRTGFLVRQFKAMTVRAEKIVGSPGKERTIPVIETRIIPEYVLDVGLLREMRAIEEATAKELGQTKPTEINVNVTVAASDARERIEERLNRLAPRVIDTTAETIDSFGVEPARVN